MLDAKFIEEQKEKLEAQKAEILKELKDLGSSEKDGKFEATYKDIGESEDDNTQEVQQYVEDIELVEKLQEMLSEVNGALNRIEKGTYGICTGCGEEIDKARLIVFPSATLALKCKLKEEKKKHY